MVQRCSGTASGAAVQRLSGEVLKWYSGEVVKWCSCGAAAVKLCSCGAAAGSFTQAQTSRARGERTVASAPVQASSHSRPDCTRTRRANSRTRARAGFLSLTHRLHAHAKSEQSHPRPCRLIHSRTDCTRTRRANSRARARAGLLSLLHTGCTRTRRANSRTRARAGSSSRPEGPVTSRS